MERLRVLRQASSLEALSLQREPQERPPCGEHQVVVAVHYAAVNPSDVKATLGAMPHAVWPRTPGRDWAGVVCDGPADLIGQSVFGSGGDLGITRDGAHAAWLVLPRDAVVPLPPGMTLAEAGALGVPFITAQEGFCHAGRPGPDDVVLVMGANGKVGEAAVQIASAQGATVFAVTRGQQPYRGHASGDVRTIDAAEDVAAVLRAATNGHGADIVFNTVGSPYFAAANAALALEGRQVLISTIDRAVPFDIRAFYRGRHCYVGVDSLALDSRASAAVLRDLVAGFAARRLRAFPVPAAGTHGLDAAHTAYRAVLEGARDRIVFRLRIA